MDGWDGEMDGRQDRKLSLMFEVGYMDCVQQMEWDSWGWRGWLFILLE